MATSSNNNVLDFGIGTNTPDLLANNNNTKYVLLFWAPWHEAAVLDGPMDTILKALAATTSFVQFGRVNADDNTELCDKYGVTAVPTFVLLVNPSTVFEIVEGNASNVSQITQSVQRLIDFKELSTATTTSVVPNTDDIGNVGNNTSNENDVLNKRIERLIHSSDVMIFIKGTPSEPKCGFTRQVIELLEKETIPYSSFNILTDESIRQGLKQYSNWPTYPQIYIRGELIGGLDILKELTADSISLREQWNINTSTTSTSSTDNGTAAMALSDQPSSSIEETCKGLMNQERIMLFMKGLPSAPRCGFSRKIVEILDSMKDVEYGTFDILQDENVRQTLKVMNNWPTFPQLYANGELIGGLDIVQELYDDGTLQDTLLG